MKIISINFIVINFYINIWLSNLFKIVILNCLLVPKQKLHIYPFYSFIKAQHIFLELVAFATNKAVFLYINSIYKIIVYKKAVYGRFMSWSSSKHHHKFAPEYLSSIIWCWGCCFVLRHFLCPLTSLSDAQRMSLNTDANWFVSLSVWSVVFIHVGFDI